MENGSLVPEPKCCGCRHGRAAVFESLSEQAQPRSCENINTVVEHTIVNRKRFCSFNWSCLLSTRVSCVNSF